MWDTLGFCGALNVDGTGGAGEKMVHRSRVQPILGDLCTGTALVRWVVADVNSCRVMVSRGMAVESCEVGGLAWGSYGWTSQWGPSGGSGGSCLAKPGDESCGRRISRLALAIGPACRSATARLSDGLSDGLSDDLSGFDQDPADPARAWGVPRKAQSSRG
jgi:hypothetical protein